MNAPVTAEQARALHTRLLANDPIVWSELCQLFLSPLILWLTPRFPKVDPHLLNEAAANALMQFLKRPTCFDPDRAALEPYLRMSARGDLLNLLRTQARERKRRRSLESVDLASRAGNYVREQDDPSWRLRLAEERALLVPPPGLREEDRPVWELMQGGERSSAVYAAALGLSHLPLAEQRRQVKRARDRVQKRIDRAGVLL